MLSKPVLIILMMELVCYSCRNSSGNKLSDDNMTDSIPYEIDIEQNIKVIKPFFLNDIASKVDYIILETKSNSLIKGIDQIAFSDSFIFISNYKTLLKFNMEGKIIGSIGRQGRGPGEYGYINDFYIDTKNKRIRILDVGKILEYNFDGEFLRTIYVPRYSGSILEIDSERSITYLINIPLDTIDRKYSWNIIDNNGKIIYSIRNNYKRIKTPGLLIRKTPLFSFNNEARYIEFGCDTLFRFINSKSMTYAVFNIGKRKMPYDFSLPVPTTDNDLARNLWVSDIVEDFQSIYFCTSLGLSDSIRCGLFNKETREMAFVKNNYFINNIDEGPQFWPVKIIGDTLMVSWTDGYLFYGLINSKLNNNEIKNPVNRQKLENLRSRMTITSNPVLMLVR